ncbi:MAG: hypothetical protein AB7O66_11965 [Limisphaerales bacterium]
MRSLLFPHRRDPRLHGPGSPSWSVVLPTLAVLTGLVLVSTGCQREEIAAYDAPKDAAPPAAPPPGHGSMAGGLPDQMPPRPGLRWKDLPTGWTELGASGMRVANFSIAGADNGRAELAVIPLPGTGGSDLDLVNLWRGQLSLPPIAESELPAHTDETTVAGQTVRLFSIVGTGSSDAAAAGNQILVAAIRNEGFTWFFKLGGDAASVMAQREPLKAFLAGVEFTAPAGDAGMASAGGRMGTPPPFASAGGAASSRPSGSGEPPKPKWQVPEAWQAQAAPQMVHSKWTVPGANGATADVTVSVFPGETGGLVPNLNRWRSQVGLSPAPDAELLALQDNLDVLGGKATLADFEGTSPETGSTSRIVAAIVRRDGFSWFYKLLGASAAVEAHRESFVQFIQTAQYTRGS